MSTILFILGLALLFIALSFFIVCVAIGADAERHAQKWRNENE